MSFWQWVVPAVLAALTIGLVGLAHAAVVPALEQGQELRQALITIAIAIIADQMIAHFPRHVPGGTVKFGGNPVGMAWPGWANVRIELPLTSSTHSPG